MSLPLMTSLLDCIVLYSKAVKMKPCDMNKNILQNRVTLVWFQTDFLSANCTLKQGHFRNKGHFIASPYFYSSTQCCI
jgi:hypothetical protein